MAGGTPELTDSEPFEVTEGETGGEVFRFEAMLYPSGAGPDAVEGLSHRRFFVDDPDEHVHPHQEERITGLSGEGAVAVGGDERRVPEDEAVTLPADTPHRHWNPTDDPIRVAVEQRPARESAAFFETLYALAQAGRTDEKGLPNLLQSAVTADAYPGHVYATDPPVALQRVLWTVLAPVGRALGYEATHSREQVDERS